MKVLFAFMILTPLLALATVTSTSVSGIVKSYDETSVTIEQNGKRISLPRKYFGKTPLQAGHSATAQNVSLEDLQQIK